MNDLPPSSSQNGAAASGAVTPLPAPVLRREPGFIHVMQRPQSLVLLALAVLLAAQAWTSHSRITALRGDMAAGSHSPAGHGSSPFGPAGPG